MIGLGEVRRKEESFTTLHSGHLLYHSEANKKWKDNISNRVKRFERSNGLDTALYKNYLFFTRVSSGNSRVAELLLRITDIYQLKIFQIYAQTTSHSDEETDNIDSAIDNTVVPATAGHRWFGAKVAGRGRWPLVTGNGHMRHYVKSSKYIRQHTFCSTCTTL